MIENPIGQKVYEIIGDENNRQMNTKIKYTIVKVKDFKESNDWCQHFIIRDYKGNKKEIREFECVVAPKSCSSVEERISQFLEDNGVYAEVCKSGVFIVSVSINGDWKHEHGWGDVLMGYLGYTKVNEDVVEENGSDWYGSIHRYVTNETAEFYKKVKEFQKK